MRFLKSILVLGAGELGLQVIKSLAQSDPVQTKKTSLTVLLRPTHSSNSQDTATIEALGATIIRHDISGLNIDSLAAIFAKYSAVVSCTGFASGPGAQLIIAQAALAAKVKRFFPWQFGIDYDGIGRGSGQPLFDEQLDVRDLLRQQRDVDWVIVSTGIFMSFVFSDAFGVVEGVQKADARNVIVRALGSWDNGLTATSVEDVGRLTAILVFDQHIKQQVVPVAGSTFMYDQLADIVSRVKGGKVQRQQWGLSYLFEVLRTQPGDIMKKYRAAFAAGRGVKWDFQKTYNAQRKIQVKGVEEWLTEHLRSA